MNVDFLKEKGRSEIAKAAGVSINTARYWIEGKTAMKVDDALRIARYFSVPIQKVVGIEFDDSPVLIAALDAENRMLQEKIRMILSVLGVQKTDEES